MKSLASIDLFNLDDTAFAPANGIDGMHAKLPCRHGGGERYRAQSAARRN
jgi:hypothetical protein